MSLEKKRWLYVVAGFLLLLFSGLVYAWSIFVKPLEAEFGWARSETSLTFSICMAMFCIGGLFAGFMTKKKSAAFNARLAAVLLCVGFVASSRVNSLMWLYISYGVVCGFGVGLVYNAVMGTVTKWFPDKQGFISGILLMGFGFGGMVLGQIAAALIASMGFRKTFIVLGVASFVIILIGSLFIVAPDEEFIKSINIKANKKSNREKFDDMEPSDMLKRPSFWLYFVWAILLGASGLAVIGHASPMAQLLGVSTAAATFYAGLISIFNGVGRVITGFAYDKAGRKRAMLTVNLAFMVSATILLIAFWTKNVYMLVFGFVCIGLSYGGVTPINSAFINSFYGTKNFTMNFALINLNLIIASFLGPYLAGVLQTTSGGYLTTFVCVFFFGAAGLICNFLIKRP
ncbi:MAG: OFA family MFS transporter [Lachnospiraceae bacterium]|nr:OFA family MFS transporter [Lachnospiraceae bacterium]